MSRDHAYDICIEMPPKFFFFFNLNLDFEIEEIGLNRENSFAFLNKYKNLGKYFFITKTFGVSPLFFYPNKAEVNIKYEICDGLCWKIGYVSDPYYCTLKPVTFNVNFFFFF